MASKYAGLKGKIPEQKTEREASIQRVIDAWRDKTFSDVTAAYNERVVVAATLAIKVKENNEILEAFEILVREKLDALEGDAVTMNGYTWSPKFEPYPICEDPASIVEYFKTHGMEDQLALSTTELAGRLKKLVKEEALNNELQIEIKTVTDPETGEEQEVTEVRSNVPGVKVFLKGSLSRVKVKGAK